MYWFINEFDNMFLYILTFMDDTNNIFLRENYDIDRRLNVLMIGLV